VSVIQEVGLMDAQLNHKILDILAQHRIMTIATLRPDGWPQATTVGYANEGLTLYFLCGLDSQKAANIARNARVSIAIDHDTPQVMEITGLSMAGRAQAVTDREAGHGPAYRTISRTKGFSATHAQPRLRAHRAGNAHNHLGSRLH
jgi:nitroimidazol reductase NimA-like FMN-containing flavoprotein (pyridoxamine 5'-phosphate oxidase superfamily)